MAKLTRRTLIKRTSIGVAGAATLGVLTAVPHLEAVAAPSDHVAVGHSGAAHSGLMVAHVRDFAKGEIGVMFGEKEVVLRDPDLVKRLLKAAG